MNLDELAALAGELDAAAFAKRFPLPALVLLVPTADDSSEETRTARALQFGRTRRLSSGDDAAVLAPRATDADATSESCAPPRRFAISAGSMVVFVDPATSGRFTVGRSASNQLCVPLPSISRAHAFFESSLTVELALDAERPGGASAWLVADLDSSNGTTVNGESLPRGGSAALSNGDLVGFGPDAIVKIVFPGFLHEFARIFREERAASDG